MKNKKSIFLIMLAMVFSLSCSYSVFAEDGINSTIPKTNNTSVENFVQEKTIKFPLNFKDYFKVRSSISEVKVKTEKIYSRGTGKSIGTVSLRYQTEISGGRPVFVLSSCYATMSLSGTYRGDIYINYSTPDVIKLEVSYNNLGIDSGTTLVQFTP